MLIGCQEEDGHCKQFGWMSMSRRSDFWRDIVSNLEDEGGVSGCIGDTSGGGHEN